ncbi:trypsin-like serine protease [Leptospira sp. WS92.C1]
MKTIGWKFFYFVGIVGCTSFGCISEHSSDDSWKNTLLALVLEEQTSISSEVDLTLREDLLSHQNTLRNPVYLPEGERQEVVSVYTSSGSEIKGACSGVLIDSRWVLTAAHCVCTRNSFTSNRCAPRSRITVSDLEEPYDRNHFGDVIAHPGYNPNYTTPTANDIALIRLDTPLPSRIQTARLLFAGDTTGWLTKKLVEFGFGKTGSKCKLSPYRDRVDLVGRQETKLIGSIGSRLLFDLVACPGDSGGPIFNQYENRVVALMTGEDNQSEWFGFWGKIVGTGPYIPKFEGFIRRNACGFGNPNWNSVNDWCGSSNLCKCNSGQGHCNSDSECHNGLVCKRNVGERFGYQSNVGVCHPPNMELPKICFAEDCRK